MGLQYSLINTRQKNVLVEKYMGSKSGQLCHTSLLVRCIMGYLPTRLRCLQWISIKLNASFLDRNAYQFGLQKSTDH